MVGSRVYVGGLPYGVRERDLEKFFKGFGRTRDILIKNGYGFVEFEDYRDADDAVYELNGKELLGERVVVEPARGVDRGERYRRRDRDPIRGRSEYGPPTRTEYRLIVENLSSRISWQDLKDYMRQAGEVTYADAHKQHHNEGGRSQSKSSSSSRCGVVEFASHSDMRAALDKLDNTELNGRRIRLVEDVRSSRRRSRSSSRSRSRSRRRSRTRSRSRRSTRSRSRSKSKVKKSSKSPAKSRSRSRDKSLAKKKDRSRSRSARRSRSPAERSRSPAGRSRSRSPVRQSKSPEKKSPSRSPDRRDSRDKSVSRDRSRSKEGSSKRDDNRKSASRSRSRSASGSRSRSRSGSPRQNGTSDNKDRSPNSGD